MKQELAEEGSRCSLLAQQRHFNEHCCIRCCAPFTFLLNPKRQCLDCHYNVCKTCRTYSKGDKAWLCSACQKGRVLRVQSLEWYYNNVKSRFKRFGSAKVLKTLYRKHIIERGALSDLPEDSLHEGSNDNDGSICGSEAAFYRQSEGHSMAETLTVALRVAEEAIEEAIAKAEEFSDSLEKQNEARYLRDHKEELIEELATTIVQKIIQRRKRSEMQTEYHDLVWPQSHQPLSQPASLPSPSQPHTSSSQGAQDQLKTSSSTLWRSRSAFSLTSDDSPEKGPEEVGAGALESLQEYTSLKREPKAASLPSWKSMDRLDNSSASSVLQSPDGNWIALPSSQLSRPSLLAKRKSLVYSVLEKESGVVSAYDEMGSESDGGDDERGWVAALRQFRRKLSDETYYTDSQHDPEWTYTQHIPITSPSSGQFTNTETLNSDSEASSSVVSSAARPRKPPHNLLKKRGPTETLYHHHHHNVPPYPLHPDTLDVNFNPKVLGDSSEADERHNEGHVRRSRRRRKSRRGSPAEQGRTESQSHTQSIYPLIQEDSDFLLNALLKRTFSEEQSGPDSVPGVPSKPALTAVPDASTSDDLTPEQEDLDTVAPNSVAPSPSEEAPSLTSPGLCYSPPSSPGPVDPLEEELHSKLSRLAGRASSQEDDSSSEDDKPTHRETSWLNGRDRSRREAGGRPRDRSSSKEGQRSGEAAEQANTEEGRARERRLERGKGSEEKADDKVEEKRGGEVSRREGGRQSKRQEKREVEEEEGAERRAGGERRSGSSASSPAVTPSPLEEALLDGQEGVGQKDLALQRRLELLNSLLHQKYSAASLCSITTEVLKVLNATEELIGEAGSESHTPAESMSASPISSSAETSRLDQRLTKMEENVYLAAGAVYGLEGALGDLEECARSVSSGTTDTELSFLEDQVATAAAQVQQSELKISNIEARISALKTAGLNVTACNRFSKFKPKPKPQTLDSSRHQRRKLPAPPLKGALQEKLEPEQQVLQP